MTQTISLRNYWENTLWKDTEGYFNFSEHQAKREARRRKVQTSSLRRESVVKHRTAEGLCLPERNWINGTKFHGHKSCDLTELYLHIYLCWVTARCVFHRGRERIEKGNLARAAETWLMTGANSLTQWANSLVTPHHPGKIVRTHFLHLKSCTN